jgi:hypothetical protein
MIGFDRPIRPRWIYESLLLAEPGQKLAELNEPFGQIARELTGKEGKRKVRTVLFRCFLRDEQNRARVKKNLVMKDLSVKHGLAFMQPVYLFYLVARTDILKKISEHIFRLYDYGREIKASFLKAKMVDSFGERDVVIRSAGAFIKTLEHFNVVEKAGGKPILKKRLMVNEEQARIMLQFFALEVVMSPQISLNHLPEAIFNFFDLPDLKVVAQRYNGDWWEYQHRMADDYLIINF